MDDPMELGLEALAHFVKLGEQLWFSKSTTESRDFASQILELAPAVRIACKSIADERTFDRTLDDYLSFVAESAESERSARLPGSHLISRFAQWHHLMVGLNRLKARQKAKSNLIASYISFAREAMLLADKICSWFPFLEPDWSAVSDSDCDGFFPCPRERCVLIELLRPRYTPNVLETLYHRAIGEARERGEAVLAVPRLERIEKALDGLVGVVDSERTSTCGKPEWMELNAAIFDAMVLISTGGKSPESSSGKSMENPPQPQTPTPPDPVRFCFWREGQGFWISGFGDSGFVKFLRGFEHIFRLLEARDGRVPMVGLVAKGGVPEGTANSHVPDPVFDDEGLRAIKEKRRQLDEQRDEAMELGKTDKVEALDREIETLEAATLQGIGVSGRSRNLDTRIDSLRATIHSNLRRAIDALRTSDPPLTALATHFESFISAEGADFVYRPVERPDWILVRNPL